MSVSRYLVKNLSKNTPWCSSGKLAPWLFSWVSWQQNSTTSSWTLCFGLDCCVGSESRRQTTRTHTVWQQLSINDKRYLIAVFFLLFTTTTNFCISFSSHFDLHFATHLQYHFCTQSKWTNTSTFCKGRHYFRFLKTHYTPHSNPLVIIFDPGVG